MHTHTQGCIFRNEQMFCKHSPVEFFDHSHFRVKFDEIMSNPCHTGKGFAGFYNIELLCSLIARCFVHRYIVCMIYALYLCRINVGKYRSTHSGLTTCSQATYVLSPVPFHSVSYLECVCYNNKNKNTQLLSICSPNTDNCPHTTFCWLIGMWFTCDFWCGIIKIIRVCIVCTY